MLDLAPKKSDLDPIEIASRDEIAALQLSRLKQTLRHAYDNVPCYRAKLDAAGVGPDDCRDLSDLKKFPFTTKSDLRDAYPFGMVAIPPDRIARVHASSGTTGKPTVVAYSQADLELWTHVMARSIRAAGGRPGMKAHNAYGYGLFTGGLGFHYGAERLGCAVIPVSGGMTERQVQLIHDFEPDIIMVTPSYMLAILDEFRRVGLDPRASSLKVGIFGAEPWTNAMRAEIEQSFDMHAIDLYGLSEVIGPGVACECVEAKDGPHDLGGPFLSRGDRSRDRRRAAGRAPRRARAHHAHQGGDAGHPLSHARPDAASAGHGANHAPHGEGDRPLGRHDHPARRQPLSLANRGADPQMRGPCAAFSARAQPPRAPGRADGGGGSAPEAADKDSRESKRKRRLWRITSRRSSA